MVSHFQEQIFETSCFKTYPCSCYTWCLLSPDSIHLMFAEIKPHVSCQTAWDDGGDLREYSVYRQIFNQSPVFSFELHPCFNGASQGFYKTG